MVLAQYVDCTVGQVRRHGVSLVQRRRAEVETIEQLTAGRDCQLIRIKLRTPSNAPVKWAEYGVHHADRERQLNHLTKKRTAENASASAI